MADKSSRLLLDALCRAAAEPAGLALLASKSDPGLFPATARARIVADRCKTEGYLQVVRSESRGKLSREICVLTDKGREYLLRQSSPRDVLEDLVRVLESRQNEVAALAESVRHMQDGLRGIQSVVEQVLPRLQESSHPRSSLKGTISMNGTLAHVAPAPSVNSPASDQRIAEIKSALAEWHAAAGVSQDCPLPELYRGLHAAHALSIGQFHDALRQLHDDTQIYLHPWTGPLYAIPEPAYALLIGHEIAYYASIR